MLLSSIVKRILLENEEAELATDQKMVEKTLKDTFEVTATGLDYLKYQLEKLSKKATRIGVAAPEYKIVSERDITYYDENSGMDRKQHRYTIKIEGKSPVIDGYEFIANIEHTDAGNIINISPGASVRDVPEEYRTSTPTCDYCHTKRDRNNTFVLKKEDTGEFMKVGRSCLKNFLGGKDPKAILEYANFLSFVLTASVGAEGMGDGDDGGGNRSTKYYNSDDFLLFVCMAYSIMGRYLSKSKATDQETPTAQFALTLMHPAKGDTQIRGEVRNNYGKAKALFDELNTWMETKDWDSAAHSNPTMSGYFHNLKVVANSPAVQYKNANLHASVLAIFLREKAMAEKKKRELATPKSYIGEIGKKVSFVGIITKIRAFDGQWGPSYMIQFEDENGNDVVWFSTKPAEEEDKKIKWKITGTVKKQEVSKYTHQPQTTITRAKMEFIGNIDGSEYKPFISKDQWGNEIDRDGNKVKPS